MRLVPREASALSSSRASFFRAAKPLAVRLSRGSIMRGCILEKHETAFTRRRHAMTRSYDDSARSSTRSGVNYLWPARNILAEEWFGRVTWRWWCRKRVLEENRRGRRWFHEEVVAWLSRRARSFDDRAWAGVVCPLFFRTSGNVCWRKSGTNLTPRAWVVEMKVLEAGRTDCSTTEKSLELKSLETIPNLSRFLWKITNWLFDRW